MLVCQQFNDKAVLEAEERLVKTHVPYINRRGESIDTLFPKVDFYPRPRYDKKKFSLRVSFQNPQRSAGNTTEVDASTTTSAVLQLSTSTIGIVYNTLSKRF